MWIRTTAAGFEDSLFNVLLDISSVKDASVLCSVNDFRYQVDVCDHFTRLHDADNGRLGLVSSVSCDTLVRLFVFFFGLLGLNLIDLDAILWVGKVGVN